MASESELSSEESEEETESSGDEQISRETKEELKERVRARLKVCTNRSFLPGKLISAFQQLLQSYSKSDVMPQLGL